MGEEQIVNLRGLDRPALHGGRGVPSLSLAAVHHEVQAIGTKEMAGAGDAVPSAECGRGWFHCDGLYRYTFPVLYPLPFPPRPPARAGSDAEDAGDLCAIQHRIAGRG